MPNRTFKKSAIYGSENPSRVMGKEQQNIVWRKLGKEEREVVVL